MDGGAYAACTSGVTFNGLSPNAQHTFGVRSLDPTTSFTSSTTTDQVVIDTTAPLPTITVNQSGINPTRTSRCPLYSGTAGTANANTTQSDDDGTVLVRVYTSSNVLTGTFSNVNVSGGGNWSASSAYNNSTVGRLLNGTYYATVTQLDGATNTKTVTSSSFTVTNSTTPGNCGSGG